MPILIADGYGLLVSQEADDPSHWEFEGRHYTVTRFSDVSTRDGYGWELWEDGPPPAKGQVLEAFWDDTTGLFTLTALTTEPLPFELVEHFVARARVGVPPVSD